jgi:uncharacterized membrane protein
MIILVIPTFRRNIMQEATLSPATHRDNTVDILRGFAIFTMIAANMIWCVTTPYPFVFRFYGTWAAPTFTFVVGMMVTYTALKKGHGFKYYLLRGAFIMFLGALQDMLTFKVIPFYTVDILYLIGLAIPRTYLFFKLPSVLRWIIVLVIFFITPILQAHMGYTDWPTYIYFWGNEKIIRAVNETNILNHWIIDGWFPTFPWLIYPFLGAIVGQFRWKSDILQKFDHPKILCLSFAILIIGAIIWYLAPGPLLVRYGYSELFYPPTYGFMLTSIGLILLLLVIFDRCANDKILQPIDVLGQSALIIYLLHYAIIYYVIYPLFPKLNFSLYLLIYIVLAAAMIGVAYILKALKTCYPRRSLIIRLFMSG